MTKNESKHLRRIIEIAASKRGNIGLNFKEIDLANDGSVIYLIVWCDNTAYRHELNALMMAVDGFGYCNSYQRVDEDYNIVWEAV